MMNDNFLLNRIIISFLVLLILPACKNESGVLQEEDYTITTRLAQEPDALFPFYATSNHATRVMRLMYQSLMDIDPENLELIPVLASGKPDIKMGEDVFSYRFQLRDDAFWHNESPITVEDVEFTIKTALIPGLDKSGISKYLTNLVSFQKLGEYEFIAEFTGRPFLSEEVISTLLILPEGIYDPDQILSGYAIEDLKALESADAHLRKLKKNIDSLVHEANVYEGSNAYAVKRWTRQQGISLERKENWWGNLVDEDYLQAKPKTVDFAIIPDEGTALTAFRNGQIDIFSDMNSRDFKALKRKSQSYKFYETTPMNFYYIALNNRDKYLKDKALRKALSLCFNAEEFIRVHMDSLGTPVQGPIHPSSPYFLNPKPEDVLNFEKAKKVLTDAGYSMESRKLWTPEGEQVQMEMLISDGEIGKILALLLKENAAHIGIDISISTMKFTEIRKRLLAKSYQITPLSLSTNPFRYDPYQSWHSDNADVNGPNIVGFNDSLADAYIETIRSTDSEVERIAAYKGFQERIVDEKPVIFVAAPVRCIVTQQYIEVPVTSLPYACDLTKARKLN